MSLVTLLSITALVRAQDEMDVDAAQEPVVEEAYSDCGKGCCEVCCDQSSIIFGAEATWFKFHQANGVEDAGADDASFDYELNPRITLGYVGCDGLGARARYWRYDENATSVDGDNVSVDTYNLDFEVFQVVELGSCTCLDISAGLRYNDFEHNRSDGNQIDGFDGLGGMVALEAHRDLCNGFGGYARLREVIMMDDAIIDDNEENDVTRPITEIAIGVRYTNCNWSLNAGYEWQNWGNYTGDSNEDDLTNDIGFSGFVVGAQYSY
jgi:hypothetical protein